MIYLIVLLLNVLYYFFGNKKIRNFNGIVALLMFLVLIYRYA